MLIAELLAAGPTLSVELWPARSAQAALRLEESLDRLESLRPSFASITYGAAGSTRERTHELVMKIQQAGVITPMAHLVTAAHRRVDLVEILSRYQAGGITNVLALRGDPPLDATSALEEGELKHAIELVELAKSLGDFCVAVAAHPEGHPSAPDLASDRRYLASKLTVADFAITQFFFRIEDYLSLVDDLAALGVTKPVIPGIMPITNVGALDRMAELSGCALPASITERVRAVAERPDEVRKLGIEIATDLCDKLLAGGVPGLHFYTMNQLSVTLEVCENLGL